MNIMDKIGALASGAADLTLQKFSAERVGAEAKRRGLFEGYVRSVPSGTFTDLKRERHELFSGVTDDELVVEFAKRKLLDVRSRNFGWDTSDRDLQDEKARVHALALELAELVGKL